MTNVLTGRHAEDIGDGRVVEPGQPIPSGADPEVVKRLQTEGKIGSGGPRPARKKEEE